MSLKDWADNGWLKPHKTSKKEVSNLLGIVKRDLADAKVSGLSPDAKFATAYNAALKLCTIALYASGYRTSGNRAHYHTLEALPLILGKDARGDADYLSACLNKRNQAEYDYAGVVDESDALELLEFVVDLHAKVSSWMTKNHSSLL